jgi:hypothetical protein
MIDVLSGPFGVDDLHPRWRSLNAAISSSDYPMTAYCTGQCKDGGATTS